MGAAPGLLEGGRCRNWLGYGEITGLGMHQRTCFRQAVVPLGVGGGDEAVVGLWAGVGRGAGAAESQPQAAHR